MNPVEKAVAEVLGKYEDALNQSDTDAVMKLYARDGVFMPQNSPSSVGAGEVRQAYDAVFKTIKLTVQFNIAEVVEIGPVGPADLQHVPESPGGHQGRHGPGTLGHRVDHRGRAVDEGGDRVGRHAGLR